MVMTFRRRSCWTPSAAPPVLSRGSAGDHHVQAAWSVHAFDPVEFDVAGGGGAADPGLWAGGRAVGQAPHCFGHPADDLVVAYDDEVAVRDQGGRAAALGGAGVQDDG